MVYYIILYKHCTRIGPPKGGGVKDTHYENRVLGIGVCVYVYVCVYVCVVFVCDICLYVYVKPCTRYWCVCVCVYLLNCT